MVKKAEPKEKTVKKKTPKATSKNEKAKKDATKKAVKKPKTGAGKTQMAAAKKATAVKSKKKSVLSLKKRKRAVKKTTSAKTTRKMTKKTAQSKSGKTASGTKSKTKKDQKAQTKKATPKMKKSQTGAAKTKPVKDLAIKNQKKLKTLIAKGKKQGFLTYEEINELIPDGKVSAEQIDNTLIMLGDMNITITDKEKIPKQIVKLKAKEKKTGKTVQKGLPDFGTVTDPVKMYLREMGLVTLLSREGEVEIAKKIEAGEQLVLRALLDTQATVELIIDLGEHIEQGRVRPNHILKDVDDNDMAVEEALKTKAFLETIHAVKAIHAENQTLRKMLFDDELLCLLVLAPEVHEIPDRAENHHHEEPYADQSGRHLFALPSIHCTSTMMRAPGGSSMSAHCLIVWAS